MKALISLLLLFALVFPANPAWGVGVIVETIRATVEKALTPTHPERDRQQERRPAAEREKAQQLRAPIKVEIQLLLDELFSKWGGGIL